MGGLTTEDALKSAIPPHFMTQNQLNGSSPLMNNGLNPPQGTQNNQSSGLSGQQQSQSQQQQQQQLQKQNQFGNDKVKFDYKEFTLNLIIYF